jgi:hypothetical protein
MRADRRHDASFTQSVALLVADVQTLLAPGATPQAAQDTGKTRYLDWAQ